MLPLTFLQRRKFTHKQLPNIAINMIGLIILCAVSLSSYKNSFMNEKKQELKHVVETATSARDLYSQRVGRRDLPDEGEAGIREFPEKPQMVVAASSLAVTGALRRTL